MGSLRLEGLDDPALANRRAALLGLLPQPGQRFQDEPYRTGSQAVEESLRSVGRARATCTSEVRRADSLHVGLVYQVQPGPACRVDSLVVTGVKPDLIRLARRSLSPLRGRPCTTRLLALAQERLSLLGVYRQIRFQLLEAGVGWWTTEGGRVSARLSHANLFAGGRGLQVGGSFSRVRQTGRVETWWPALILPTLRGELQLLQDRQQEENYHMLIRELRVGGRVQPSLLLTYSGGLAVSVVNLDEFSPDSTAYLARPGRQTVFNVQALRNSTDDPLDPHSGTLPNRRFFAGGMDHRGFGRHLLGPLDEAGAPIGPVRTDLGLRVGATDDEQDAWALHVSIGHSF